MRSQVCLSHRPWLALAVLVAAATACSSDQNTGPLVATSITASAGASQSGTVATALAAAVEVTVTDQDGNAVSNATVSWLVTAGGGTVASAASQTDARGKATVIWTLGTVAGVDSLQASIASGASVKIGAIATAGPMTGLVKVSGDAQSILAGTTSAPLVVRAVDIFGNGVANITVTWSVQGGGTLSSTSTSTDTNGQSSVTLLTGAAPATYTVTAVGNLVTNATFTVNGT
ncbi:MAG TPA: Ig-like domain-containing protein [Gemmatimonadaceae bacterium]|nr:Ig-like domain-containing protein [Gemmatimonadaceae bacterium]